MALDRSEGWVGGKLMGNNFNVKSKQFGVYKGGAINSAGYN